jgi:hypothetical protein
MKSEPQTLRDIYRSFVTGKIAIDEAGRQVVEYARLHRIEVGSLDLGPMSDEEGVKAGQLLDYLLHPIEQQFLLGRLSKEEAARQIASYLAPHAIWALTFNTDTASSEEQKKLEELRDYVMTVIEEFEPK